MKFNLQLFNDVAKRMKGGMLSATFDVCQGSAGQSNQPSKCILGEFPLFS